MKLGNTIELSWDDLESMVADVVRAIDEEITPDLVVGVTRGGLIPAVMLSHAFNRPMETIMWQTRDGDKKEIPQRVINAINTGKLVMIVDDINDSGKTLSEIENYLDNVLDFPGSVMYVTMVEKAGSMFELDYSALTLLDERWVVFPYE